MKPIKINTVFSRFLYITPLIIFLLFWEFAVSGSNTAKFLFASPSLVFRSLFEGLTSGVLLIDLGITSIETILGFLLGNICGTLIGLSLWYSVPVAKIARPYITGLGSIPIFAIAPMMIMWFGTGLFAKVMMACLSVIVIAIVQAYEGAKNVDIEQIRLLKSFGATKNIIFIKVIIPSSLIWVLSSYKINIGFALLGAFIGEFISSEVGLGHRILQAGGLYNVPLVIAAIICMMFIALFMSWIIGRIEKKLLSWKYVR